MTIMAFLQNQWFKDPDRVRAMIEKNGEKFRQRIIAYSLFAGCLTGRRLQNAFGKERCEQIIWEESSKEIGGHAASCFLPDPIHCRDRIVEVKPDVILAFGTSARMVVSGVVMADLKEPPKTVFVKEVIYGPHPAARGGLTVGKLSEMARKLDEFCLQESQ